MSDIKVVEGLEPWQVLERASEGEPVASLTMIGKWVEVFGWTTKSLAGRIADGRKIAIIDTTTPKTDFNDPKWNWDFFNQYGGVPVGWLCSVGYAKTAKITDGCSLRESPFYYWPGGEQPVPDNVEVEVIMRNYNSVADTGTQQAHIFTWQHDSEGMDDIIAFKLTGRVL